MPSQFPTRDNDTGKLVDVTYFTTMEVADMFRLSARTVRRRCLEGAWPHMRISGTYWLNAEHVAAVVEILTHDPMRDGAHVPPRRLGILMDPDDVEGLGGVR